MDELSLKRVEKWRMKKEYQKMIDALEKIQRQELDYNLCYLLADAYNCRGGSTDYEKAIELLMDIRGQGESDPAWHFCLGSAYYYGDKEELAEREFLRVLEIEPGNEKARFLLNNSRESLQHKAGKNQEDYDPELYSGEEVEVIEDHICRYFGEFKTVLHEIISPDIHVDICIIPPNEHCDCYILTTMGMGAHRMNVPEELAQYKLERAELVICLSKDWNLQSDEEIWYWPIRCLKRLARLPGEEDTWLGWGHTIDNQEPFAENTALCGSLLISTTGFDDESEICVLPNGEEVNFYQVIPVYHEEMEFKMAQDAESLLNRMDARVLAVDRERQNFCTDACVQALHILPPVEEEQEPLPTFLKSYGKNVQNGDWLEFDLCSSAGNSEFEIWYYGQLYPIKGEPFPYITGTDFSEARIVARDVKSGEEILLFDGTLHGYNAMFCDAYTKQQRDERPLIQFDAPAAEIHISVGQGIDYDDERDEYETDEDGNILLIDHSAVSWEQVKRDGFDYMALYFKDENGELIQFMDEELA